MRRLGMRPIRRHHGGGQRTRGCRIGESRRMRHVGVIDAGTGGDIARYELRSRSGGYRHGDTREDAKHRGRVVFRIEVVPGIVDDEEGMRELPPDSREWTMMAERRDEGEGSARGDSVAP